MTNKTNNNSTQPEKLKLYELAVANQGLLRLYPLILLSYIFPPALLVLNFIAIFFVYRVVSRLFNVWLALLLVPIAFLPLIGLFVLFPVMKRANTVIEQQGFRLTMDKESLKPIEEWVLA